MMGLENLYWQGKIYCCWLYRNKWGVPIFELMNYWATCAIIFTGNEFISDLLKHPNIRAIQPLTRVWRLTFRDILTGSKYSGCHPISTKKRSLHLKCLESECNDFSIGWRKGAKSPTIPPIQVDPPHSAYTYLCISAVKMKPCGWQQMDFHWFWCEMWRMNCACDPDWKQKTHTHTHKLLQE